MRVAVVGGGVIAWRLVRQGADVTVYDPGGTTGAGYVAARMVAAERSTVDDRSVRLMAHRFRRA